MGNDIITNVIYIYNAQKQQILKAFYSAYRGSGKIKLKKQMFFSLQTHFDHILAKHMINENAYPFVHRKRG